MQSPAAIIPLFILLLIGLTITALIGFSTYTGLSRGKGLLALFGSAIAGGIYIYVRTENQTHIPYRERDVEMFYATCAGVSFVLITGFVLRLWSRWVGEHATPAERLPGKEGVRAWFSASNVAMSVLIAVAVWFGFRFHPLFSGVILAGLLAAYPLLRMETSDTRQEQTGKGGPSDLTAEREKILAMLEAGKLTPEESAELLQALGAATRHEPPPARTIPMTHQQRFILIGAALVLLGFFFPWFTFNPGQLLGQTADEFAGVARDAVAQSGIEQQFGPMPKFPFPGSLFSNLTRSVSGVDIPNGLGWFTLILALVAAALPYVAVALDSNAMRTVRGLCLGIGALVVIYLLSENIRFASVGIIMVACGYALEIVGMVRARTAVPNLQKVAA